jgi:hypothetical protein
MVAECIGFGGTLTYKYLRLEKTLRQSQFRCYSEQVLLRITVNEHSAEASKLIPAIKLFLEDRSFTPDRNFTPLFAKIFSYQKLVLVN